jgi:hypothetical protein
LGNVFGVSGVSHTNKLFPDPGVGAPFYLFITYL